AAVTFWLTARSPAGAPACPDIAAAPRSLDVPADDLAAPIDPSETRPGPQPTAHPPRPHPPTPPPTPPHARRPKPPPPPLRLRPRPSVSWRRGATTLRGACRARTHARPFGG